jgi:purine-binding chemotaxis protein CheW
MGAGESERLLAFEVGGMAWGVPIRDVSEVADLERVACIPTLPPAVAGVANHHGDALPVVQRHALFDLDAAGLAPARHLLVLGDGPEDPGCLGLPVDRVLGLVDGVGGSARGPDAVVDRRPLDGRILNVLDVRRLLERAREVIERSVIGADASFGGRP